MHHDDLRLTPRSPQSYDLCGAPDLLADWLTARGFVRTPTLNVFLEYRRFAFALPKWYGNETAILVIYKSGAILLQGTARGVAAMRERLAPLVAEPTVLAEQNSLFAEVAE